MNKIGLSLLLLVLLGFVVFLGGQLPYFLFYIFALAVLLPLIHTIITLIRLNGEVLIPKESLYKGDNINIVYQVDNRSPFLIPYLTIDNSIHSTLSKYQSMVVTALPGKELYRHSETINLNKRGYFEIGEIEVIVQDIFKLFKFKKKIASHTSLLVYPKTIKLNSFRATSNQQQGELISDDGSFEDKSRINSLRDYVEGDSIKSMHWKLTAKKDFPMIKLFENRVDSNIGIFLDNSLNSYWKDVDNRLEDKAVDVSLSIIDYCLDNNLKLTLLHQNKDENLLTNGSEIDDLKPFLEVLAKLRATGKTDFTNFILNNIEDLVKGSSVVIVTPLLDKSVGAITLDIQSRGYKPLLITIKDSNNRTGILDDNIRKKLIKESVPVYNLDYYTNIKVALEDYGE